MQTTTPRRRPDRPTNQPTNESEHQMSDLHKRPALDTLAELRRGRLNADLTDEIHDLIAACTATGKKGEINLKLIFEPDPNTDSDAPVFRVSDSISVKTPRPSTKPSLFYVSDEGNFTRSHPLEKDYSPLMEVPQPDSASDTRDARSRAAGDRD
ncbi:MAG: hypothetical protein JWO46_1828 [Nocardioidaceae bacterium]|nr:hypothetical protein [Nocardioidaceae bacterium]